MSKPKSQREAEIQSSIGRVLFEDWDPIGVNDNPNLADEYDNYIAPVYRILTASRSEEELIDSLFRTERKSIGCSCENRELLRPVA